MDKLLLKPTEVAEMLRIGRSLVYTMLATGELPSIRVGHCIRVPKISLEKWINDQEKVNGGDKGGVGAPPTAVYKE
jgi:excisionase family DNA binding protein